MLLERIYDEDLAHASYFIGCQAGGIAIVVDPRRDVGVYLDLANKHGMSIIAVAETHIHADFLSGTRELAGATGAQIYVSDEGGPDWTYGSEFDDAAPAKAVRMKHGDHIQIGNIRLEAVHTPGHTPEHLAYLITDGAQADEPGFMLTGDFVFVGDVGRPDLLDEAAGYVDTRFEGAKNLFASLRDRFLTLPDYVQVLPAHGSGSACGKALGAVPTSTVGYERNFAWWGPYLANNDEQGFIAELLSGQPDAHAYFARMKEQNKLGPALIDSADQLRQFTADELRSALAAGEVVAVDIRHHDQVHAGTLPDSLNVPGPTKAASYGAWAIDPETEMRPLVLVGATAEVAREFRDHLVRVGIDTVAGFIPSLDRLEVIQPHLIAPQDLAGFEYSELVDVRNKSEYAAGHIPGADQLSAGRLMWHLDELPPASSGTIVTYCQSGVRNSVAASALRRAGYDVAELDGSFAAWAANSTDGSAIDAK